MDQKYWRVRMTRRKWVTTERYFVVVAAENESAVREKMSRFVKKGCEIGEISEIPNEQSSTGILIAGGIRNYNY